MSFKIAVATKDGKNIDTAFATAKKFLILEVESDGKYVEEGYRGNPNIALAVPNSASSCGASSCGGCGGGCGGGSSYSVEFLWDCHYVLATSFGHKEAKLLNRIFIDALEVSLPIDKAVVKVALYDNRVTNNGANKAYREDLSKVQYAERELPEIAVKEVNVPDDDLKAEPTHTGHSKAVRIALASSDGKVINQHFGHATTFHVFDIIDNTARFVESRDVNQCCNGGTHKISAFEKVANTLSDCKGIIVAKIGEGASAFLENKGFEVFEAPYLISAVLEKLISDRLLEA